MATRPVFHGTHRSFLEVVKTNGLMPPPGHGVGVRVRLGYDQAMDDAKAWAAFMVWKERLTPVGMIAVCFVPEDGITDVRGTLRVKDGIPPSELHVRGPFDFTDLFFHDVGRPTEDFWRFREAWDVLTAQPRRTFTQGLMPGMATV